MAGNEKAYIDWPEVNRKLPVSQDPKSRAERKALFRQLLPKQKKALSLDDVQKGIKNELRYDMASTLVSGIKEMTRAIRFAFKASSTLAPARNKKLKSPRPQAHAKVDTGMSSMSLSLTKSSQLSPRPDGVSSTKSPQVSPRPNGTSSTKSTQFKRNQAPKATVDRREFHAFLLSLRYYLELAELFENLDGAFSDDQRLSCRECLRGKDKLAEWGLAEEMVRDRFKEVDIWIPLITFDQFAEWVMSYRWEHITLALDDSDDEEVQYLSMKNELVNAVDLPFSDLGAESDTNKLKLKEVFTQWDIDSSGGIDEEELAKIMTELNPRITTELAKRLFTIADVNNDGVIDYDELIEFLFQD